MARSVVLIQDGAVDELMSVALLTTMPVSDVSYAGCIVVNGDCLLAPTIQATHKILDYMAKLNPNLPTNSFVFADEESRAVNAFPWTYRQYSLMVNLLPALNSNSSGKNRRTGLSNLTDVLRSVADQQAKNSDEKAIALCLGPLTPVAATYESWPDDWFSELYEVVWMGGVISPTPGNIDPGIAIGANPDAEWNAYWDPYAVDTLIRSDVEFTMFPLNVTNDYLLNTSFFEKYIYPNKSHPMVDLAGQMYSTVAFEAGYSFWDTVTTAYIGKPDLFSTESKKLKIETDILSPQFGTITEADDGSEINVAKSAAPVDEFYEYFIDQLKSVSD